MYHFALNIARYKYFELLKFRTFFMNNPYLYNQTRKAA